MKRNLELLLHFFRINAIAELEFRANIFTKILSDVVWYLCQLSVFEVLFRHIPNLAGWDLPAARLFMAMLFLIDVIYMFFFHKNLHEMRTYSQSGELDLILAKPVNSQFFVSTRLLDPTYLVNISFLSVFFYWTFVNLTIAVSPWRLLLLIILIPCSVLTIYAISFSINCLAIIFTRAEYATYLWYQIYRFGTRPDTIYPPWLRYILLSLLPAAMIASVPSRLIAFEFDFRLLLLMVVISFTALWISTRVWKIALKNYSSASS